MNDESIIELLKTIASNQPKLESCKEITISKVEKETKDFYCLAVPGKAFFIRSNGKVSVTGNTLHCHGIITLFHTFLEEHPEINRDKLRDDIVQVCRDTVEHEDAFIDLAYGVSDDIRGCQASEIKDYIRFIANMRLLQLGYQPIYSQMENPCLWVTKMLNGVEHANFFESRVTTYSRASSTGTWEEVFDDDN